MQAPHIRIDKDDKEWNKRLEFQYFLNEFMHPITWFEVLDKNPSLHLCLAHFGGIEEWTGLREHTHYAVIGRTAGIFADESIKPIIDDSENDMKPWAEYILQTANGKRSDAKCKEFLGTVEQVCTGGDNNILLRSQFNMTQIIAEMIQSGKYKNLYTDLAFLPIYKHIESFDMKAAFMKTLQCYPALVDRILFGTDWYMLLRDMSNAKFRDLCNFEDAEEYFLNTKKTLDYISEEINDGKDLWELFTSTNPKRFFGLHGSKLDSLRDALIKAEADEIKVKEGYRCISS